MKIAPLALALLAAGCASAPPAAAPEWKMEGSRIIGCCCAAPCPCRINRLPQHCHGCDGTTAVHIDRGFIGKTRLDGVDWVVVGRSFAEDKGQNWVTLYVSDKASDEQFEAVKGLFEGSIKEYGPKAAHLAGKISGIRKVPIAYSRSADRREWSCTIPGVLELRTRSIVLPGHTTPAVSTGIFDDFGDTLIHADALAHTYSDAKLGAKFDLTGRQSNQAEFVLDSIRAAKGGIGWGCYSGHKDLGSKDPYQEKDAGHK